MKKEPTFHVELTEAEMVQIEYQIKRVQGTIQYAEVEKILQSILKKLSKA